MPHACQQADTLATIEGQLKSHTGNLGETFTVVIGKGEELTAIDRQADRQTHHRPPCD